MGREESAPFPGVAAHKQNRRTNVNNARLAQSAERKALNLVVVGSSPTVGAVFAQKPQRVQTEKYKQSTTNRRAKPKSPDTIKQRSRLGLGAMVLGIEHVGLSSRG